MSCMLDLPLHCGWETYYNDLAMPNVMNTKNRHILKKATYSAPTTRQVEKKKNNASSFLNATPWTMCCSPAFVGEPSQASPVLLPALGVSEEQV